MRKTLLYDEVYNWAYAVGRTILEQSDKGDDLLRALIFNIRGEDLPGRFLEKLSSRLTEYKTNRNIAIDVSMQRRLFEKKWYGDSFRYMKSAVLSGLLNSLGSRSQKREEVSP
jgi:hypothetical protein